MGKITCIDEIEIRNKRVLLRLDLNASLSDGKIANDFRIRQSVPTIKYLLTHANKLTIISHIDRPKQYDPGLSLAPVVELLNKLIPDYEVLLGSASTLKNQTDKQIFVLENIRFYPQEYDNDPAFSKELAGLGDIYVNDAFSVCHENHASIVGVPRFTPSYGGLLLKREVEVLTKIIDSPEHPLVAIVGGIKTSKVKFANKLRELADKVLVGSGMTEYFQEDAKIVLPKDFIKDGSEICDIGVETEELYRSFILSAKTIIWTGPMGKFEDERFRHGTDYIFEAIAQNQDAFSIIGGGDTIAAISKKEHLDKITYLSTGGGAMLEFIEKGTLPGLEALKK